MNEKTGIIIASFLLGVGLVAGCSQSNDTSRVVNEAPHNRLYDHRIYDFFLEDGTRCVYVDGVREGGLSCDFDANRRRAE